MIASKEDRRFPRTRSQVSLRYEALPVAGKGFVDAHLEDLSPEGLRFQCRDEVGVRSGILLELQIPDTQPVHFVGRAVWVRELQDHTGFEVGGMFEDQNSRGRTAVERFLQHDAFSSGL